MARRSGVCRSLPKRRKVLKPDCWSLLQSRFKKGQTLPGKPFGLLVGQLAKKVATLESGLEGRALGTHCPDSE